MLENLSSENCSEATATAQARYNWDVGSDKEEDSYKKTSAKIIQMKWNLSKHAMYTCTCEVFSLIQSLTLKVPCPPPPAMAYSLITKIAKADLCQASNVNEKNILGFRHQEVVRPITHLKGLKRNSWLSFSRLLSRENKDPTVPHLLTFSRDVRNRDFSV